LAASDWDLVHLGDQHHGIQPELQPISARLVVGFPRADVLNRANLGMEVMHERNAHNFLDLAAGEATPVALTAPTINA